MKPHRPFRLIGGRVLWHGALGRGISSRGHGLGNRKLLECRRTASWCRSRPTCLFRLIVQGGGDYDRRRARRAWHAKLAGVPVISRPRSIDLVAESSTSCLSL